MLDGILDGLRCLSELGSCSNAGPRWYGRTRRIHAGLQAVRIARLLCIPLGIAGLIVLDPAAPWPGGTMIGVALAVPVLTWAWEFWLIGRRLMVLGPVTWPPTKRKGR